MALLMILLFLSIVFVCAGLLGLGQQGSLAANQLRLLLGRAEIGSKQRNAYSEESNFLSHIT